MGWLVSWALLVSSVPGSGMERYVISPQKSQFQFKAYSLLAKPLGVFHTFSGEIVAEAQMASASRVHFVIDAASIDTGNAKRDRHLRTEDFLFVDRYPQITFLSTAITTDGSGYTVQGNLQIRGVTKQITIPITVEQQQEQLVVRGNIRLNRRDFGMNYNAFFNPVQDKVDVMFTIVAVKP